jgi:pyruvate dehydrogenase E2 component (dihydrolipoamide acetyltransferase)
MKRIEIKMPDLSTTGGDILIVNWIAKKGDTVAIGQPIVTIETDKATMDVESVVSGALQEICVAEGLRANVGDTIAVIFSESVTEDSPVELAKVEVVEPQQAKSVVAIHKSKGSGSIFARNKAASGKIPSTSSLNAIGQVVAARMLQSKQTIPHFYLTRQVNAGSVISCREGHKPEKIVWDAFFVKAIAESLKKFERLTYSFVNNALVKKDTASIGIAVDIEDDLYVIAVREPLAKSISVISKEILEKVEAIRKGDPSAKKMEACLMTVTNLGSADVSSFTAIVNPPEAAILAVGKISPMPIVENGQVVVGNCVNLTLSVDHRIANGKYAANFLGAVVERLESIWD